MPIGSVLSGIGSLAGAGASLATGLYGAKQAREVAEQELALQRQQMDEQRQLNQFQMDEYLDKKDYDRALQERILSVKIPLCNVALKITWKPVSRLFLL